VSFIPIDHAARVAMIQARLPLGNGCDALLFTDLVDVRWLTGFTGSNGWAVLTAGELVLGTDGRYGDRARAETASSGATVIAETSRAKLHERLVAALGRRPAHRPRPGVDQPCRVATPGRRHRAGADRFARRSAAAGQGCRRDRADDGGSGSG
jgi:Xaa-Pro aminopeptidase